MDTAKPPVGLIGLGLMGRPMALNLMDAGYPVVGHNRSRAVVDDLAAQGMEPADGPAAVAAKADTIILMLTDTPAVRAVMESLLGALRPGSLVIDMGTTAVTATRDLADQVKAAGAAWVDAPVSGGQVGAEAGTLSIMCGGAEADVARAMPLFDVLGGRVTHVGPVGAGQVAKAANQVIVGLTIGAVAEALTLARRAGVDPAKVRQALTGGFADSRILDLHGRRMVDGDFTPGGRATVQRKDMQQALDLAAALGLDLPATTLNRDLYDRLIAQGDGDLDHSALIRAIDRDGDG
ncbi:MAG: NAD(P)-dependent oxidoreductase [Rhodobacterales bacterium]|nr:NAD(P)-dependent oxidoreductase [Rhodobacterales bacterium]